MKGGKLFSVCTLSFFFLWWLVCPNAMAGRKHIFIAGGRTTSPWYAFAQALAKFINEKSILIEAEAVSTAGITADLELVREKPHQYIGISSLSHVQYRPGHKWARKRGVYTGERFIAIATSMTQCIVTYDKNIKSVKGLGGKVIDVGRRGGANTPPMIALLKRYGVLNKVKLVYTGYGGGAKKLQDGLVDATFLIFNHIYPHKFSKGSFIERLETRGSIYYVGFDKDILLELYPQYGTLMPVRVPARALDPITQPNDLWAFNDATFFMADEKMDPDIVYEVTRIIWETPADRWARWHPTGAHMNKVFKSAVPLPYMNYIHKGAKRFYKDNDIKLKELSELLK